MTSNTLLWITSHDDPATLCVLTSSKVIFFNPSAILLKNRLLERKVTHARSLVPRPAGSFLAGPEGRGSLVYEILAKFSRDQNFLQQRGIFGKPQADKFAKKK